MNRQSRVEPCHCLFHGSLLSQPWPVHTYTGLMAEPVPWDEVPALGIHLRYISSDCVGFLGLLGASGDAGAVFAHPAKHLNSNEQRRKNRKEKNKPIRKLTVMLRCVPEKVKEMETRPGQPFRSLWSGLPSGNHILSVLRCLDWAIYTLPSTRGQCRDSHPGSKSGNDSSRVAKLESADAAVCLVVCSGPHTFY